MEPNAFISSRLDYCNQLFVGVTGRMPDKPILEHCCSPGHWNQKIWPHYTCDVKTWLATSPSVDQVQDSCSGLRVPSWTSFGISVWVLQVDDWPFTPVNSQCVPAISFAHMDNMTTVVSPLVDQSYGTVCGTAIKWHHGGDFPKIFKNRELPYHTAISADIALWICAI